jgi:hypothetical protein
MYETREVTGVNKDIFYFSTIKLHYMAQFKARHLILTSGKQIKLGIGTIGIFPSLELGNGFPDLLFYNQDSFKQSGLHPVANPTNLTADEIHEIADYMVLQWTILKENIRKHGMTSPKIFSLIE